MPFRSQVRRVVAKALGPKALALAAVLSCASETLQWAGRDGWLTGNLLALGTALICCRLAAAGLPPFTRPTWDELAAAVSAPVLRLALSFGVFFAAAFWAVNGGNRSSPWFIAVLLGLATIWLLPPAVVDAAIERSEHPWLAPWSLPRFSRHVGDDIRPVRIATAVLVAFAVPQALVSPLDFRQDMNLFRHIVQVGLLHFGEIVALLVLASLCGTLVFTRAQEFDHGDPAKHLVPVSPEAKPRGRRAGDDR
jgi:hypothetical protein